MLWGSQGRVFIIWLYNFCSFFVRRYGDKAPRSVVGRLWGVVWIIVGINTMSFLFTLMNTAFERELHASSSIRGVQVNSGPVERFSIKTSHCQHKNETVVRPSYLYNANLTYMPRSKTKTLDVYWMVGKVVKRKLETGTQITQSSTFLAIVNRDLI